MQVLLLSDGVKKYYVYNYPFILDLGEDKFSIMRGYGRRGEGRGERGE